MEKSVANGEDIGFGHSKVPIEDFNEFALDPPDVAFAEGACDHGPVDIFQSRVVGVFGSDDEGSEEHAVKGPLLGLNGEIRPSALDVEEGDKDVGDCDLSPRNNICHELGELGVLAGARDCASAGRGGGWDTEGKRDDLSSRLDDLFCEMKVSY